ncbi:hypothetical protein EJB05_12246, partial [Eragrostis curvula]
MDHLPLPAVAAPPTPPPQVQRVLDTYKRALATAASVTAYAVLARSMARELLPDELRAGVRWAAALVRARFFGQGYKETERRRHTIVIRRCTLLYMEPGDSTTDVFDGVAFTWTSVKADGEEASKKGSGAGEALELSFDAEHTDAALERYVPFVVATAEDMQKRNRPLWIHMNEGPSWHGINHHHPATFDTLAMDPELKRFIVDDLNRFLSRRDYYRRIGKAWKRGYLLYGPPGTGKSSLVAAMANYLRFSLYDLDLSQVQYNNDLQRLLIGMPNKSILVIEDIDCCFDSGMSRKDDETPEPIDGLDSGMSRSAMAGITLSGLLNFIDGLWSTSGEERIIIFTTNYKDRLDQALLRPGRMDVHVYMGYCSWEAFKTLARNYFLVDDHHLFPEIQELLAVVEVTPAEVSEMLLRNEDVDAALRVLAEFLQEKRRRTRNGTEGTMDAPETTVHV